MFARRLDGLLATPVAFTRRSFFRASLPGQIKSFQARLPVPATSEKIQHGVSKVKHPNTPLTIRMKGEEHIFPIDIDYMHVTPEDEKIGLVLNGLHPETSLVSLKKYLKSFVSVRDCWIYRQGVVCIRLEDEKNRNLLRNRIESLKTYPLPIYDPVQRNWLGKASDTQPLLFVEPLNANFDPPTPDHGKILLMRSVLYMPLAISAIFRPYKTRTEEVRMVRQRLTTHGKTIYEYLLGFPTIALAQKALSNHAGEEISIPYRYLLTEDKVRFPHGKTMHIWLRQTGLSNMPTQGFQEMTVDEVPPRAIEAEENALPYAKEEADEKV